VDAMLIVLWHIWKARNAMIFNTDDLSSTAVLRGALNDLGRWACHFKGSKHLLTEWSAYFQECLASL
jgi:hypothetical protein